MNLQIILCVEADKRAATDNIYVKETINRFYTYGNDRKISFVNMGGKSNYNSSKVISAINRFKIDYKIGRTVVIYCVDLDRIELNSDQIKENKAIEEFTVGNQYELVWFCHDVEEVYVGRSIDKSIKTKTAVSFKTKGEINKVKENKLDAETKITGRSNILIVLDKYLSRKDCDNVSREN